jgi:hypothetical protein
MRDFRRGLSGEADSDPKPVVVQSTTPVVETAAPVAEPEPVPAAAAAEPVAEPVEAEAKPAE